MTNWLDDLHGKDIAVGGGSAISPRRGVLNIDVTGLSIVGVDDPINERTNVTISFDSEAQTFVVPDVVQTFAPGLTLQTGTTATDPIEFQGSPALVLNSSRWVNLGEGFGSQDQDWIIQGRDDGLVFSFRVGDPEEIPVRCGGWRFFADSPTKPTWWIGDGTATTCTTEHGIFRGPTGFDLFARNVAGDGDVRMIRASTAGGMDGLFVGSSSLLLGPEIVRIQATNVTSNGVISISTPGTNLNESVAATALETRIGHNNVERFCADATGISFFAVAPVARPAAYTPTNVTPDRAYDANATTLDEVADVVGTLIADLQLYGLLQ